MRMNAEAVAIRLEDSEYGPTLTVDRDLADGQNRGVLHCVDRLATLVITAGAATGKTFIWDPAEIGMSPIG